MANEITRVDFCKKPVKQGRSLSVGAPLDTVTPLGIASLGCQPAYSHRALPGGELISRVNQQTGSDSNDFFTTTNDADLGHLQPGYSAYLAAYQGANALTGSVANPYPGQIPNYDFRYTYKGFDAFKEQHPVIPGIGYGSIGVIGFGHDQQPYPSIFLHGGVEYDGFGKRFAYKQMRQRFRGAVVGTDSQTAIYDPDAPELKSQASGVGFSFSTSLQDPPGPAPYTTYFVNLTMWPVRPSFLAASGDTVDPSLLDANNPDEIVPPGFTRHYALQDFGNITMSGWTGSVSGTYPLVTPRPWMVIYADTNITGVSLNGTGLGGFGGSLGPIRLVYSILPPITFPQSFSSDIAPTTNSFQFDIGIAGHTLSPMVQVIGDGIVPNSWEGYLVGQIVVTP